MTQVLLTNKRRTQHQRAAACLVVFALLVTPLAALAQGTRIEVPKNKYSVQDDIKLGQQTAAEAERQLPIVRDEVSEAYLNRVGQRLAASIPPEFQHPEFRYSFKLVNQKDINAFALPGGFMYVNTGMILAARNEGEMAGVMAHEMSHVALRHGTAQATETQKYQIGSVLGQIAGSVIGGGIGQVIGAGSQIGFGAGALRYSRKYETQADILGAQIMARAGYDPRDLANMFRTIERQGGGRGSGPEWLSSHPNPGNRYERINQEAQLLRVNSSSARQDTRDFQNIQARLRGGRLDSSAGNYGRNDERSNDSRGGQSPTGRVELPSARLRAVTPTNFLRLSIPDNWQGLPDNQQASAIFAPRGAYGNLSNGQFAWTHGVQVGAEQTRSRDLRQATDEYLNAVAQGNPNLRRQSNPVRGTIDGREAYAVTLNNVSEVTGRNEVVTVYTTMLRSGDLFYMIAVAPQDEYRNYQRTFQNILRTVQLSDQ